MYLQCTFFIKTMNSKIYARYVTMHVRTDHGSSTYSLIKSLKASCNLINFGAITDDNMTCLHQVTMATKRASYLTERNMLPW